MFDLIQFFILIIVLIISIVFYFFKKKQDLQERDDFISLISHDLKNPISGIKHYARLMLYDSYGNISKETRSAIKKILQLTKKTESIIEDMLKISHIESERIKIDFKKISLCKAINAAIDELKFQANEKNLYIKVFCKENIRIFVDEKRFKYVLVNIISNAIKYTQKGGITIKVNKNQNNVEIKFSDTGIGIEEEDIKKVFDKFYRVKRKKTRFIKGTGLGLWIVRNLTKLMNGKLEIKSKKNIGTEIKLIFKYGRKK